MDGDLDGGVEKYVRFDRDFTNEITIALIFIIVMIICLVIFISPAPSDSAHWQGDTKEWRSDYNGRNESSCCGEEDCWIASVRVIENRGETSVIEVDGMIIEDFPTKAIHISQDQNSYACHPYQVSEFGYMPEKADGSPGWCEKHTKDKACINCIFVTGGA